MIWHQGESSTKSRDPRMQSKANKLWEQILRQTPRELASSVKESARECHTAISKFALRDDVDTDRLDKFQTDINHMLNALRHLTSRLTKEDNQVKSLCAHPTVKRYFELVKTLQNRSKPILTHHRKQLEQQRDSLFNEVSKPLKQIRAFLRECLILRLEMIRYWKAFLWKAIEIYAAFRDTVRDSLRSISDQISDTTLRALVTEALSDVETFPIKSFSSIKKELKGDLTDIDRRAIHELEELREIESRYETIRTSAVELEQSDALLQEEIHRSRGDSGGERGWTVQWDLIHKMDLEDKAEKHAGSGKIFTLSKPKE